MFTFLTNWKLYILAFALMLSLASNGLLRYQNSKLVGKLQICEANAIAQKVGTQVQEKHLRLTEQEAAQAHAESLQRKELIMLADAGKTCEENIAWMIANKPI